MTFDVIATARRRTRRLLLVVVAGLVVLLAAVCTAGLYSTARLEDTPVRPVPTTTGTPAPATTSGEAVPVVLPADVTWVSVAGVALPVSETAGPHRHEHGLASGFAHTPTGALLAAAHLLVNTTPQVGSDVFGPTLQTQVVGQHAPAMRAAVAADYRALAGESAGGGPVGSLSAALAGVRMSAYAGNAATVDLLTVAVDSTGTARFAASLVDMAWTGSDWALVAPPEGRWDGVVRAVTPSQAAAYPPLGPGR
jgi:hypothetical protein